MGVLMKRGINYTGSGDILNQPVIYSDSERCIGVWRDGKPLYQKTFSLPGNHINDDIDLTYKGLVSNIDSICAFTGIAKDHYGNYCNIQRVHNVTSRLSGAFIQDDKKTLSFRSSNDDWVVDPIITIQYTKTTDTAGTGPWAPTGATPIHYSLEEQVIGTWIDGKPLYQKSFQFLNYGLQNGDNIIADISFLNYDIICDIDVIMTNSAHTTYRKLNAYFNDADENVGLYIRSDKTLNIHTWAAWSSPNIYITLKYTKTTD